MVMVDKYPSVAALMELLGGKAYRIICRDRAARAHLRAYPRRIISADITVIAPHGGFIEAGTSQIATAIAGAHLNLFDFQGLQEEIPEELHVTSTKFRHPDLTRMLRRSAIAVAIHGMGDQGHKSIWLGGLNTELKALTLENLRVAGFAVNPNSPKYRGVNPLNVVNLAQHRGVQLELSNELRAELFANSYFSPKRRVVTTDKFHKLVKAVRTSIEQWRAAHPELQVLDPTA